MYKKFKTQSSRYKITVQNLKFGEVRRWYFLTIAVFSFIIFLLALPKGDTSAQEKLAQPADQLITQNDSFQKMTPDNLKMSFPIYTPPPKIPDYRLTILKKYLSQFNSPLIDHVQDLLDASDTYSVDWRLVPAIAGVESTFGRSIPGGHDPNSTSYNGWGWGVYGDHVLKFSSWRQAIFAVTKGLKQNYLDQGLTNPFSINKKYASDPDWGTTLTYFLNDLDYFTDKHLDPNILSQPKKIEDQFFQNYTYLKEVDNTHFSMQFAN